MQHRQLIFRQFSLSCIGRFCQCLDCEQPIPLAVLIASLEFGKGRQCEKPAGFFDDPALTRFEVAAHGVRVPGQPRTNGELNMN